MASPSFTTSSCVNPKIERTLQRGREFIDRATLTTVSLLGPRRCCTVAFEFAGLLGGGAAILPGDVRFQARDLLLRGAHR